MELLTDSDFEPEQSGAIPNAEASEFLKSMCSLCFIICDWLNMLRPGSRLAQTRSKEEKQRDREIGTQKCLVELESWHRELPSILRAPPNLARFSLWAATLHITYCATMLRFAALLPDGMQTVHLMASEITNTCKGLHESSLLGSLWNFGIHELDLAMGQHARLVNRNSDDAAPALKELMAGLPLIQSLSERSSVAAQGAAFYETLIQRSKDRVTAVPNTRDSAGPDGVLKTSLQAVSATGEGIAPIDAATGSATFVQDWLYDFDEHDLTFSDWVPQTNHPWGWDIVE